MPTFSDPDNEDSGGSLSEVTTAVRKVVEPDPLCVTTDVLVTEKAPVLDATGAEELVEAFVLDGRVDDDLGGTEAEEKLDDVIDGVGADEEVDALLALEWLRGVEDAEEELELGLELELEMEPDEEVLELVVVPEAPESDLGRTDALREPKEPEREGADRTVLAICTSFVVVACD